MEISYDPVTDALYLRLSNGKVVDSVEVEEGVIVDYDEKGHVIGVEILGVKKRRLDLNKVVFEPEKVLPLVITP